MVLLFNIPLLSKKNFIGSEILLKKTLLWAANFMVEVSLITP